MRGTITLAAALSIPVLTADGSPFPSRDIVIFLSLGVIVVTLLLQGMTLESVICWLRLPADTMRIREERVARISAVEGGLLSLRALAASDDKLEESAALRVVVAEYEHRLAELTAEGETQVSAQRRRRSSRKHRLHALRAERHAIDDLWRRDIITIETHRPLQQMLDHEESLLEGQPDHVEA
jgi:CPA1 family monovalent cation:H+ antiporter